MPAYLWGKLEVGKVLLFLILVERNLDTLRNLDNIYLTMAMMTYIQLLEMGAIPAQKSQEYIHLMTM